MHQCVCVSVLNLDVLNASYLFYDILGVLRMAASQSKAPTIPCRCPEASELDARYRLPTSTSEMDLGLMKHSLCARRALKLIIRYHWMVLDCISADVHRPSFN